MCCELLWDVPLARLVLATANLKEVKRIDDNQKRTYWMAVSRKVDRWARLLIPFVYFSSLILLFNLDMSDEYSVKPDAPMFGGPGKVRFVGGGWGLARSLVFPVIGLICFCGWLVDERRRANERLEMDAMERYVVASNDLDRKMNLAMERQLQLKLPSATSSCEPAADRVVDICQGE